MSTRYPTCHGAHNTSNSSPHMAIPCPHRRSHADPIAHMELFPHLFRFEGANVPDFPPTTPVTHLDRSRLKFALKSLPYGRPCLSHSCPLNATGCLKGAAIATDRLSLPLSIIHAFEERITRHFSQPLPFVYKYTCFNSHLHPLTEKTSYHFSQESLISKSCMHHLFSSSCF